MKLLVPFGTRPEIVKLAPVVRALEAAAVGVRTVATGQHHEHRLTRVFYDELGFEPSAAWELAGDDAERTGRLLTLASRELEDDTPDAVLLLGDTNTVPAFCLAARHRGVPVVHVEAGLRSFNETSCEEVNRRVAAATASLHFAPTPLAAEFLAREGVDPARVHVVGNPVVDAVRLAGVPRRPAAERRGVLFTAHRATNVDDRGRLERIVELVVRLAENVAEVTFPLHHRTRHRLAAAELFPRLARPGVRLVEPLPYTELLRALARSTAVVTDSGGLQEEAAWLGVPAVVLRRSTPRWEAVTSGMSALVGLDVELALETVAHFSAAEEQRRVATLPCPFGDGHAAERIAAIICRPDTAALLRIAEPDLVGPPGAVSAVVVDLDDTLYCQAAWLEGAWDAVAAEGARHGLDARALGRALRAIAAEGSARGRIIDRALESLSADTPVEPLVDAFRAYEAERLTLHEGVREALERIRARVPVALVTDGDVRIQRAKLRSLRLEDAFDAVVFSDELGRAYRKPHPAPFHAAIDRLGVAATGAVYIGDHPDKDVVGATVAGMRVVRVRTGEYRDVASRAPAWAEAGSFAEAVALVEPLLYRARPAPPADAGATRSTPARTKTRVRRRGPVRSENPCARRTLAS